jgi:hypothetical protein
MSQEEKFAAAGACRGCDLMPRKPKMDSTGTSRDTDVSSRWQKSLRHRNQTQPDKIHRQNANRPDRIEVPQTDI